MANFVQNVIQMEGISSLPLFTERNGSLEFDFNKLLPMPESLDVEAGSLENVAIEAAIRKVARRSHPFQKAQAVPAMDDILKTLYEIAENGDPFGYESSESGYYQEYKEQFDELAIGASSLLDALTEHDLREHWDDMTVCLLGQTTTVLGFDSVEMDYYHMADPLYEDLAVQEAQKRLSRLTKADLIRTFRTVMVVLTSFFDIKAAHDCLTSVV